MATQVNKLDSADRQTAAAEQRVSSFPEPTPRDLKHQEYWRHRREKERVRRRVCRKNDSTAKRKRLKWKNVPITEIQFFKPRIALDLAFESLMSFKELKGLKSQLNYLYGSLRSSDRPLETHVCGVSPHFRSQMLETLSGVKDWKVYFHSQPLEAVFRERQRLVYLSPDSTNVLDELDEAKIYVIGGIVDKNRLKNASLKRAAELGVPTARLPVPEYLNRRLCNSLNVNHVFDILLAQAEFRDWKKSMNNTVPKRVVIPPRSTDAGTEAPALSCDPSASQSAAS